MLIGQASIDLVANALSALLGLLSVFIFTRLTNNGWLIFHGHDVTEKPSPWGCSPTLLNPTLEAAARRKIPVLTTAEALQCARA